MPEVKFQELISAKEYKRDLLDEIVELSRVRNVDSAEKGPTLQDIKKQIVFCRTKLQALSGLGNPLSNLRIAVSSDNNSNKNIGGFVMSEDPNFRNLPDHMLENGNNPWLRYADEHEQRHVENKIFEIELAKFSSPQISSLGKIAGNNLSGWNIRLMEGFNDLNTAIAVNGGTVLSGYREEVIAAKKLQEYGEKYFGFSIRESFENGNESELYDRLKLVSNLMLVLDEMDFSESEILSDKDIAKELHFLKITDLKDEKEAREILEKIKANRAEDFEIEEVSRIVA